VDGVIFDVDGTIYSQRALRLRIVPRLAAAHWSKPAAGMRSLQVLRAYREAHEELRNREYSADLQVELAARKCRRDVDDVRAVIAEWFDAMPLGLLAGCVYPELPGFLDFLQQRRIALGVFSDYPAGAKLGAMGLAGRFSQMLCAADAGRQKPDPAGVLAVAAAMGLEPRRALYLGDRSIDMEAAARAGMRGFRIENGASYRILRERMVGSGT